MWRSGIIQGRMFYRVYTSHAAEMGAYWTACKWADGVSGCIRSNSYCRLEYHTGNISWLGTDNTTPTYTNKYMYVRMYIYICTHIKEWNVRVITNKNIIYSVISVPYRSGSWWRHHIIKRTMLLQARIYQKKIWRAFITNCIPYQHVGRNYLRMS